MVDKTFVRQMATEALKAAKIVVPPVDLDDIAMSRALRIERNAILEGAARASYRPADGLIRVTTLPPRLERFPIAHELGHAIIGDGGRACTEQMIQAQDDAVSLSDALASFNPESTASAIAGQLLVPSAWLRRFVADGRGVIELEELFDVTRSVLLIAIQRDRLLGMVTTP